MAWIIKDNRKKYKVICPECQSEVGFTDSDKIYSHNEALGYDYSTVDIRCPACKTLILLSIDAERMIKIETLD